MISAVMAWTGYWIGIGVEGFVILIAGVLLALMLTGVLFKWLADAKEKSAARAAARAVKREAEAAARAEAEAAAEAAAAEAAEEEAFAEEVEAEEAPEEIDEAEVEEVTEEELAAEAKAEEEAAAAAAAASKKKKKPAKKAEAEAAEAEAGEGENDITVVRDGIVFNDSKTITELYEELSAEQKGYFDELREEALTKPDAELSISRNFIAVKIGKRNLIKLLIKRGVTVAEFMLESEELKKLRLSNKNKRGKSSIKVKPTTVQVIDLMSLKVAVDMLNLAYEELMLDD